VLEIAISLGPRKMAICDPIHANFDCEVGDVQTKVFGKVPDDILRGDMSEERKKAEA